jgi:hypothetical protein
MPTSAHDVLGGAWSALARRHGAAGEAPWDRHPPSPHRTSPHGCGGRSRGATTGAAHGACTARRRARGSRAWMQGRGGRRAATVCHAGAGARERGDGLRRAGALGDRGGHQAAPGGPGGAEAGACTPRDPGVGPSGAGPSGGRGPPAPGRCGRGLGDGTALGWWDQPGLVTRVRCARAPADRRPWAREARGGGPVGGPRGRRQLLEPTRALVMVLAPGASGRWPLAAAAWRVGGQRPAVPPGIGTRPDRLAQERRTTRGSP